MTNKSSKNQ